VGGPLISSGPVRIRGKNTQAFCRSLNKAKYPQGPLLEVRVGGMSLLPLSLSQNLWSPDASIAINVDCQQTSIIDQPSIPVPASSQHLSVSAVPAFLQCRSFSPPSTHPPLDFVQGFLGISVNTLIGFEVANAPRHMVVRGVLPIDTGVTLPSPGAAWSMLDLNVK